jgi:CubicO group peptidase (beta-lactamase class C family)
MNAAGKTRVAVAAGAPPAVPNGYIEDLLARHTAGWPGTAAVGAVLRPPHPGAEPPVTGVGPVDEPFPWASVSKLLVALSCFVAIEEGSLSLDDPAGPPGSTLAHLLAHASGLPYEGGLPVAPPARRRIYSNSGIEAATAHLEKACRMTFGEYLSAGVLEPLGMGSVSLKGSPAKGATGSLRDLLRLATELMLPRLVSQATLSQATSVAWPALAGVLPGFGRQNPCDWGLGPEIRGHKSPHWTGAQNSPATYGHFGQSGSFLWVDPGAGVALAALSDTPFGDWAKRAWPALSDAVLSSLASLA